MNITSANLSFHPLLQRSTNISTFKLRKSLDAFEPRSLSIICNKYKSNYKPLKKSFLPFKNELYFIHKLWNSKSRTSPNTTAKPSKIASPKAQIYKPRKALTGKFNLIIRSKTPGAVVSDVSVQQVAIENPIQPKKPKIVIVRSCKRGKRRKETSETGESNDIQGWINGSFREM
jgi:hypothetical protein